MKKIIIVLSLNLINVIGYSQTWLGSTSSSNLTYRGGDITVQEGTTSRITLGQAWGGAPIWGGASIGINLRRESTGLWSYLGAGGSGGFNQGIVMYETGGNLMFSMKPSTGGSSGTITDADVHNNIKFTMANSGNFEVRSGDLKVNPNSAHGVTLGPSWGGAGMAGTGFLGFNLSRDNAGAANWPFFSNGANNGGSVIYGNLFGDLIFSVKPNTGSSSGALNDVDIMQNGKMMVTGDGKVVIADHVIGGWGGGSLPGSLDYSSNNYRLFVEKGILTERVRVAIKGTPEWADYVFAEDYKLMPLKKLEQYINTEKHLPEVPSAEEVVKEGIDLGQMQAKLLQKVEELTLYVIQQQKQLAAQQKEIEALKCKKQ